MTVKEEQKKIIIFLFSEAVKAPFPSWLVHGKP